ncbi:hypothetical protein AA0111_g7403 [Alternaria arborescens]|uniref:hypothetical protein n=1 Tax=Alternaria arborescens TaxID=156630 RepID=UPI0010755829|nr:hypothetical protein AA0111_g7403 [Alternaria arborescens]RYO27578.1 hypothetical protein AA0111_g7403 [Alternaria arborescens]
MAELNSRQLAILLQNWNHPVIKPFLATAAAGLAAITVYERGIPIDIDIKRLNHFIAHLAAPELGRGLYTPNKYMSPVHPTTQIFGILEPELSSTAKIPARTSVLELSDILSSMETDGANTHFQTTPDIPTIIHHIGSDGTHVHQATSHLITPTPVLSSHISGAPYTTTTLLNDTQAQNASIASNGGTLGLATAGLVATGAIFLHKKFSNYRKAQAQRLTDEQLTAYLTLQLDDFKASKITDEQLIAHLKLQLDDVTASNFKIETALKLAENDLRMSNEDKNRLRGQLSEYSTLSDRLAQDLGKAELEGNQNTKMSNDIIKRLEESVAVLEKNRSTEMQAKSQLQDELSEAQSTVSILQDEKAAHDLEVQKQLRAFRLKMVDLTNQLHSADAEKTKLMDQLAASEAAANGTQQRMSNKINELDRQNTSHKSRSLKAEEDLEKQMATAKVLRQEAREANIALETAKERISQLENEKKVMDLCKQSVSKTCGEVDDDDDPNHGTTGSTEGSQQDSLQQEAYPTSTPESSSQAITVEGDEELSQMSMTSSVSLSGELNIPRRKKREFWHSHWREINSKKPDFDDAVYELELPCFDARFSSIGIVRPAENHEDRTLESGKVVEHTKCNLCLQWYTKKDMYDHLKTCKAFWELAVRCGHCKKIFKYNTAFFDEHAPNCKTRSMEDDCSDEHFTLAKSEADATTTQNSQRVNPSSSASIVPGKQINPDAPPFTPGGSLPGHEKPIPTGPRYTGSNFQQGRGASFTGPQSTRSPRNTPYMMLRGVSPAYGSGFGTHYPTACPPNGPQAYSAPRDNSQAHRYPGQQQQGYPQTPHTFSSFGPGYIPRG